MRFRLKPEGNLGTVQRQRAEKEQEKADPSDDEPHGRVQLAQAAAEGNAHG